MGPRAAAAGPEGAASGRVAGDAPWLAAYPPDVDWAAPIPEGTLVGLFDAAVAAHGPRPCLDFLGRRWTYAEVGAWVARAAAGLRRLGVAPGDRVGLCLPNTPYAVVAYHAALRIGAVVVNLSPLAAPGELRAQVRDAGVSVLLTIDLEPVLGRALALLGEGVGHVVVCRFHRALPLAKALAFRVAKRRVIGAVPAGEARAHDFEALAAGPADAAPHPVAPGDLAVLQYTGGTTGTPKGAMLTHANLTANAAQVRAWFTGAEPGRERLLAVLPLFHVFAMTVAMNAGLAWGAEIVLLPRFEPRSLLAAIRRTRPTILPGVPTVFQAILDQPRRVDMRSIRSCISGGAPLPVEVKRAFEAASGCVLVEGYGLTEASPVCLCNPLTGANKPGSIGLPLPGTRVALRSLADPAVDAPPGARGELVVAGPQVMRGYWAREADTAATLLPGGWLRTGDVATMDAEGYVSIVDRIKDLILCSGYNVYPRMIEEALYRHPDVAAATVVGMPDRYRGESPAAFVQPREGATLEPEALRRFLKEHLSPIEMPRLIEVRAELPRTLVGKLSKKELRAELVAQPPEAGAPP